MTSEIGSIQIIPSRPPTVPAAFSKLTWGPRTIQLLAGSAIGLIGLGLIPVIGPFSAIIASVGAAILLHGLFYGGYVPSQLPRAISALEISPKAPETESLPFGSKIPLNASNKEDLSKNFWQKAMGLSALCYALMRWNRGSKVNNSQDPLGLAPENFCKISHSSKEHLANGTINRNSEILLPPSTTHYPIGTISLTDTPRPLDSPPMHCSTKFPSLHWNLFSANSDSQTKKTNQSSQLCKLTANLGIAPVDLPQPSQSLSNLQAIQDILQSIRASFANSKTVYIQLFDHMGRLLLDFEGNPIEITIVKQDNQIPGDTSIALKSLKTPNSEEEFLKLTRHLLQYKICFSIRGDHAIGSKALTYIPATPKSPKALLDLSSANLNKLMKGYASNIPTDKTPLQITALPLTDFTDTPLANVLSLPWDLIPSFPASEVPLPLSPALTTSLIQASLPTVLRTTPIHQPISHPIINHLNPLARLAELGIDAAITAVKSSILSTHQFNSSYTDSVLEPLSNTTQYLTLNASRFHQIKDNAPLTITENQENRLISAFSIIRDGAIAGMTDYVFPALTGYISWKYNKIITRFQNGLNGISTGITEHLWPATMFTVQTTVDTTIIAIRDYVFPALTGYASKKYNKITTKAQRRVQRRLELICHLTEGIWRTTTFTIQAVFSAGIIGIRDHAFPALTGYISWKYNKITTRFQNGLNGISTGITEYLWPATMFTVQTTLDTTIIAIRDYAFPTLTGYASKKYNKITTKVQRRVQRRLELICHLTEGIWRTTTFTIQAVFSGIRDYAIPATRWTIEQLYTLMNTNTGPIQSPIEHLNLDSTPEIPAGASRSGAPSASDELIEETNIGGEGILSDARVEFAGNSAAELDSTSSFLASYNPLEIATDQFINTINLTNLFSPTNTTQEIIPITPKIINEQQTIAQQFTEIETLHPATSSSSQMTIHPTLNNQDSSYPKTIFGETPFNNRKWILDQIHALMKPRINYIQPHIQRLKLDSTPVPTNPLINTANLTNLFSPTKTTQETIPVTPKIINEQQTIAQQFTEIETLHPATSSFSQMTIHPTVNNQDSSYLKTIFDPIFSNKKTLEIKFHDLKEKEITFVFDPITNTASTKDDKTILGKTEIFAFTTQDLKELLTTLQSNSQQFAVTSKNLLGTTTTWTFDPKEPPLTNPPSIAFDPPAQDKTPQDKQATDQIPPKKTRRKKQNRIKKQKPNAKTNTNIKTEELKKDQNTKSTDDDVDIDAFLRGVEETERKLDSDIREFNESQQNVAALINGHLTIDSFTKKTEQIEEAIKNDGIKFNKIEKELEKTINEKDIANIIAETEKILTGNSDKELSQIIEKFKTITSNRAINNIDTLLNEIKTIEDTLKRDEDRLNRSRAAVDKIMNSRSPEELTEFKNQHEKFTGNFGKTIILATLILSVYEQIESVHEHRLVFKPDSSSFTKPSFSFSGQTYPSIPIPPTA